MVQIVLTNKCAVKQINTNYTLNLEPSGSSGQLPTLPDGNPAWISIDLRICTPKVLKDQCVGFSGIYWQKWNIIFIIVFSLV